MFGLKVVGGFLLIGFGVIVLIYGDKKLNIKGGVILKTFSSPNYPAVLIKWAVGLVSILAGISWALNK